MIRIIPLEGRDNVGFYASATPEARRKGGTSFARGCRSHAERISGACALRHPLPLPQGRQTGRFVHSYPQVQRSPDHPYDHVRRA
jgi:hypothetical protein